MRAFADWLQAKFFEWEKTRGSKRQTYAAFARYLGVKQPSLTRWLNGDNPPDSDNIILLAEKLGPEIYDILGLPGPDPVREIKKHLETAPKERNDEIMAIVEKWLADHGYRPKK